MKFFNIVPLVTGFHFLTFLLFSAPKTKPNILLFMADDMGLGDTSAYLDVSLIKGSKPITKTLKTPNIENFAKQSMIFTDAHAPASMCSSTRYSLLTGRLSHRSYLKGQGWLPHGPNRPMIQHGITTLPEMLQRNGYFTAAIGKYHVGMDFDDGYGKPANEFDYKDVDFTKPLLTMGSINSLVFREIQKIHWTPSLEFTFVITNGLSLTVQKYIGQG